MTTGQSLFIAGVLALHVLVIWSLLNRKDLS